MRNLLTTTIGHLIIIVILIGLYALLGSLFTKAEANNKIGVGDFVMAVSYTDSYDDLQYVAHFVNCNMALDYFNKNCDGASIMMCQLEQYLYMPLNQVSDSSFDFEPTDRQSCGFVGVQKPKFTKD